MTRCKKQASRAKTGSVKLDDLGSTLHVLAMHFARRYTVENLYTWSAFAMSFSGDKEMYCSPEKKKTRHVRCPSCNGKGGGATTQCNHCSNSGYKCSTKPSDRYHG